MCDLCSHWGLVFRLAGGGPPAAAGLSEVTSSLTCLAPGPPGEKAAGPLFSPRCGQASRRQASPGVGTAGEEAAGA